MTVSNKESQIMAKYLPPFARPGGPKTFPAGVPIVPIVPISPSAPGRSPSLPQSTIPLISTISLDQDLLRRWIARFPLLHSGVGTQHRLILFDALLLGNGGVSALQEFQRELQVMEALFASYPARKSCVQRLLAVQVLPDPRFLLLHYEDLTCGHLVPFSELIRTSVETQNPGFVSLVWLLFRAVVLALRELHVLGISHGRLSLATCLLSSSAISSLSSSISVSTPWVVLSGMAFTPPQSASTWRDLRALGSLLTNMLDFGILTLSSMSLVSPVSTETSSDVGRGAEMLQRLSLGEIDPLLAVTSSPHDQDEGRVEEAPAAVAHQMLWSASILLQLRTAAAGGCPNTLACLSQLLQGPLSEAAGEALQKTWGAHSQSTLHLKLSRTRPFCSSPPLIPSVTSVPSVSGGNPVF